MSSGPGIPRAKRKTKGIEVRLPNNEHEALDAHCERTEETRTAVVRRAIRKELGLPEPKGDV
jgi:predicted DNA-binding protein